MMDGTCMEVLVVVILFLTPVYRMSHAAAYVNSLPELEVTQKLTVPLPLLQDLSPPPPPPQHPCYFSSGLFGCLMDVHYIIVYLC